MEQREEPKFGKYYECIMERYKDHPKISVAELTAQLKGVHTLEAYWAQLDEEKRAK